MSIYINDHIRAIIYTNKFANINIFKILISAILLNNVYKYFGTKLDNIELNFT